MSVKINRNNKRNLFKQKKYELNLYINKPSGEITLSDFENIAIKRLKVLQNIAELMNKNLSPDALHNKILSLTRLYEINIEYNDVISHYILRLAFCKSNELRNWFIKYETILFHARFESSNTIDEFCNKNNLIYEEISSTILQSLRNCLLFSYFHTGELESTTYYKVPFKNAINLIKRRDCYIENGYAYIKREQLGSIISLHFNTLS